MRNVTSVVSRAIRERVRWNIIGVAVSLLIVVLAFAILLKLLPGIELAKVIAALKAQPLREVLTAAGFVVLGYLTLTFYDFFALRTIGHATVPYRVAAFTSFTSYTIGHNLGATVFTAGAIRLRVYSAWGLGLMDIARMAFVTGLTFWLGNAFVLGCVLSYAPEVASVVDQLPPWANRLIGLSGLIRSGLRHGADLLVGQRIRAGLRSVIRARSGKRGRSIAAMGQPADRPLGPDDYFRLRALARATPSRHRPLGLAHTPAELALNACSDRNRHTGSERRDGRDVQLAARVSRRRPEHRAGDLRHGDIARIPQSCSRKPWRA